MGFGYRRCDIFFDCLGVFLLFWIVQVVRRLFLDDWGALEYIYCLVVYQ